MGTEKQRPMRSTRVSKSILILVTIAQRISTMCLTRSMIGVCKRVFNMSEHGYQTGKFHLDPKSQLLPSQEGFVTRHKCP